MISVTVERIASNACPRMETGMHQDVTQVTALLEELKDRAVAIASGRFDEREQEMSAEEILKAIGRLRVILARHDLVQSRRGR
jgi:hypothetical protein